MEKLQVIGRPARKDDLIQIRLDGYLANAVRREAKRSGVSMSELIRQLLVERVRQSGGKVKA
jgi:predicted HicB family RNase H-like nuclease